MHYKLYFNFDSCIVLSKRNHKIYFFIAYCISLWYAAWIYIFNNYLNIKYCTYFLSYLFFVIILIIYLILHCVIFIVHGLKIFSLVNIINTHRTINTSQFLIDKRLREILYTHKLILPRSLNKP